MVTKILLSSLYPFLVLIFVSQTVGDLFPIGPNGPLAGTPSPPGSPWPLPQQWESTVALVTAGEFEYVLNVEDCEPLDFGIEKFDHEFLFGTHSSPSAGYAILRHVYINIPTDDSNQCQNFPQFSRDISYESYNVTVEIDTANAGFAVINASTVWGALRGLETFSQLWFTPDWESTERNFYANVTTINDWPRFPHRGLMIDTARHYLPVSIIITILDAMFHNKFNVIHWHITDDQSFPFVSTRFPNLSAKGAYNYKAIYTPPMVNDIIMAARLRGIRVLFEFDTPGHTYAMGHGHPELLTPCYGDGETPGTPNYPHHAPYENLDPTKEETYAFMKELFTEILEISQDDYVHLGMDEVYYPCWNSSPVIKKFMEDNLYGELSQVQGHYTSRHLDMIASLGAKSIIWQDPFDAGVELPPNVIIQTWKDWGEGGWMNWTQQVLDAGYEVIVSGPYYLNYIGYGPTWRYYYEMDPVLNLTDIQPGQEEQILGGEVCMWSEYVDKTNIVPRLFPFASAVAERLWSAAASSTTDDAMWRLDEHRCRLLWRGIPAQPILNGFCGPWEVDGDR